MKITDIEIRLCKHQEEVMSATELRDSHRSDLHFLIISMKTDEGIDGVSMGFAGMGAEMAGTIAAQSIKPFFLGRDPLAREKHWYDFRRYDRHWHLTPVYSYGPFDIALWDIAGKVAGLPLYKLLGHFREKAPTYVSLCFLIRPRITPIKRPSSKGVASTVTSCTRRAIIMRHWRPIGCAARRSAMTRISS